MRFYDREQELVLLGDMRTASRQESRMMVVYGRRRIGKTSLILKSVEQETFVYLFVSRKNEVLLCKDFIEEIQKVWTYKYWVPSPPLPSFLDICCNCPNRDPLR